MTPYNIRRKFRAARLRAKQAEAANNHGPVPRSNPEKTVSPADLNSNPEKPHPKLLIVDDERVIADTLAMISSQYGYECFTAYDGWEGLRKAREIKPDIIITGVFNGAGPNGIDMVIQIHAEMPDTKIALFSGSAATADLLEKAVAEGHSFFLTSVRILAKPVHPQELLSFLRSPTDPQHMWSRLRERRQPDPEPKAEPVSTAAKSASGWKRVWNAATHFLRIGN
jgi:CheY-like chemotaxis protein